MKFKLILATLVTVSIPMGVSRLKEQFGARKKARNKAHGRAALLVRSSAALWARQLAQSGAYWVSTIALAFANTSSASVGRPTDTMKIFVWALSCRKVASGAGKCLRNIGLLTIVTPM